MYARALLHAHTMYMCTVLHTGLFYIPGYMHNWFILRFKIFYELAVLMFRVNSFSVASYTFSLASHEQSIHR